MGGRCQRCGGGARARLPARALRCAQQLAQPPRGRKFKPDVQSFVGHSDHVTRVALSADGTSLLTVGGGDAIFVWEFCGDVAVDEAAC